jgi:CheY-like chemotaxis protein
MESKVRRVLLVEDNDADAELVISVMTDENLPVNIDRADDGEKALDILFNCYQSRDLSCIILDIKLPKIDGLEVLKIIKNNEIYKNTPVVVFTSSAEERDIERGYMHGANAYVVKPLDFVQYREAVLFIGNFWCKYNEMPI